MNAHRGPQIPIAPFQDWCNDQIRLATVRQLAPEGWGNGSGGRVQQVGPVTLIAERLGIHVRVLNRLKRGMYAGCKNGKKGEFPATTLSRYYVEDMLTRAGVDFYDVYPEFAHERDIAIEPDEFCRQCGEWVTPIQGFCPWCDTDVLSWVAA